mgnify:FL=1
MEIPVDIQQLVLWSGVASAVALLAKLIGVPWVVARLPRDYFCQPRREAWRESNGEPLCALVLGGLKNLLGSVLVLLGVVMLFTPGQR